MAYEILRKTQLSANVYRLRVAAPRVARARRAGQFVIIRTDAEWGERIPLTIADADAEAGTIELVFQKVGAGTARLAQLGEGDALADVVGPLGRPTAIPTAKNVIVVGGGIGVAPAHPIAQAMKAAGCRVTVIIGARTKELVIMEDEMRKVADELIVVTDDGSYGRKGLVTEPLTEILTNATQGVREAHQNETDSTGGVRGAPPPSVPPRAIDEVVVVGPPVMMKFCALATKPFGVRTIASLNAVMIDGTGMCGGCRVTVGGETKFVCVDGPEFDAHQVDFDNFIRRLGTFRAEEADHKCRSGLFGK